jgi:hypothetical protein
MYLPRVIWLSLNSKNGINLKNLVDAAKKYETVDSYANKKKILIYLCKNLLRTVQYNFKTNNKRLDEILFTKNKNELSKLLNRITLSEDNSQLNKTTIVNNDLNNKKNLKKSSRDHSDRPRRRSRRQKTRTYSTDSRSRSDSKARSRSNYKNGKYLIIESKLEEKRTKSDCAHEETTNHNFKTPLHILQNGIKNISRKHLVNMLFNSQAYTSNEYDNHQLANLNQRLNSDAYTNVKSANKSTFYIVNNRTFNELFNGINTDDETILTDINNNISLNKQKKKRKKAWFVMPSLSYNYLTKLYLLVKSAYLLSTLSQMYLLNRLIGNEFYTIGISFILSFFNEIEWPHLSIFPRMTLCEIYVREIGTVHPYLIQCVLRINIFNEVIFVVIWFWLLFLILLDSLDLLARSFYFVFSCSNCEKKLFALKYLELIHMNSNRPLASSNDEMMMMVENNKNYIYLTVDKQKDKLRRMDANKFKKSHYKATSQSRNSSKKNHNPPDSHYCNDYEMDLGHDVKEVNELALQDKNILILISEQEEFDLFEKFCSCNFNNDTLFALRVIEKNASSLIVSEIIEYLWTQFKYLNFIVSNESNELLFKRICFVKNDYTHLKAEKSDSMFVNIGIDKVEENNAGDEEEDEDDEDLSDD